MLKQLLIPLAGVAAFIIFVGLLTQGKINIGKPQVTMPPKETVKIGETQINVDVADTSEERSKGLSGVNKLGENEGMLFVFDKKDTTPSFWMKEMLISLDIIWINDGKVVKIDKSVPNPSAGASDESLKLYYPGSPIDYVVEVNAGFSDKFGLKVGDSAKGNSIKN